MTSYAFSAQSPDYPVFIAQIPNPNDYTLFANAGWDGNWYVGYNNGWIKKLPLVPKGNYARAYVGAKLGRMKTLPPVGRPPEFRPVPAEFFMALSSAPIWKKARHVKVAVSEEIPLEGHSEHAIDGVGESQWFWAEVPLKAVNLSGDNYVALWSPTPELLSISSSPVLAAGWGGKEGNTWLANAIKGAPPEDPKSALASGISYFQPALALKLIPAGTPHAIRVRVIAWQNGAADHPKPVITASVEGESIERAWVEYASPIRSGNVIYGNWPRVGRPVWQAPYVFNLEQGRLPKGKVLLRIAAANVWEEVGYSEPFEVEVSPIDATSR